MSLELSLGVITQSGFFKIPIELANSPNFSAKLKKFWLTNGHPICIIEAFNLGIQLSLYEKTKSLLLIHP